MFKKGRPRPRPPAARPRALMSDLKVPLTGCSFGSSLHFSASPGPGESAGGALRWAHKSPHPQATAPRPRTMGVTGWRWIGQARGEEARAGRGPGVGFPQALGGGGAGALLMGWAWGPQLLPGEGPSRTGAGGPSTERHSEEGAVGRVGNVIKQSQRVLIKSVRARGTASKGLGEERRHRQSPWAFHSTGLGAGPAHSPCLSPSPEVAPGPGVIPRCPFRGTDNRGDTPLQKEASGTSPQSLNSTAAENTAYRRGGHATRGGAVRVPDALCARLPGCRMRWGQVHVAGVGPEQATRRVQSALPECSMVTPQANSPRRPHCTPTLLPPTLFSRYRQTQEHCHRGLPNSPVPGLEKGPSPAPAPSREGLQRPRPAPPSSPPASAGLRLSWLFSPRACPEEPRSPCHNHVPPPDTGRGLVSRLWSSRAAEGTHTHPRGLSSSPVASQSGGPPTPQKAPLGAQGAAAAQRASPLRLRGLPPVRSLAGCYHGSLPQGGQVDAPRWAGQMNKRMSDLARNTSRDGPQTRGPRRLGAGQAGTPLCLTPNSSPLTTRKPPCHPELLCTPKASGEGRPLPSPHLTQNPSCHGAARGQQVCRSGSLRHLPTPSPPSRPPPATGPR